KHGGSIDKFLGDGILASFGALRACDTCCSDALRAMDEILADYRTWAEDPVLQQVSDNALGLALSYGEVVFGPIGDGNRLEFTVIGSTVNLSAKLEKHNKAIGSRAIISKPAYDAGLVQGYQPVTSPVEQTVHVEGLSGALDVLVHFPGPGERQT
ncbi:MAG: adenylate/guanylate cyclase domain-containing protein, partial [Pseudomonadota bacterium]